MSFLQYLVDVSHGFRRLHCAPSLLNGRQKRALKIQDALEEGERGGGKSSWKEESGGVGKRSRKEELEGGVGKRIREEESGGVGKRSRKELVGGLEKRRRIEEGDRGV